MKNKKFHVFRFKGLEFGTYHADMLPPKKRPISNPKIKVIKSFDRYHEAYVFANLMNIARKVL